MRKLKKLVALALGFTCLASTAATATACGSNGGLTKSPDVLNISIFNGGYGTQYLRSVADAFEAEYPEITVKFEETKLFSEIQAQVEAGRYVADLIVTTSSYSSYGLKGHMVEISDVYDSYAYGEEGMPGAKKIVDKLGEAADVNHVEGYYYQMPVYLGTTGLIYNKTYLDAVYNGTDYELPVTSKGLITMFDEIKTKNGWPMVYTTDTQAEYMIYLRDIWTAQYLGYDAFADYFNLQYTDATGEKKTATQYNELSNAMKAARESALTDLTKISAYNSGYVPESCRSMKFKEAQAYFIGHTAQTDVKVVNGKKGAAFMVNGDWLYGEVEKYKATVDLDIRMMRTPVNSAIIDKCDSVNTEEQLVECIKYIDTVIDGTSGTRPTYLSNDDYETLLEARRMAWTTHGQQIVTIPKNCSDAEVAKNFLRFMASDTAAYIYSNTLNGMTSIYNNSICVENKLNTFTQSLREANPDPICVTGLVNAYTIYGGHSFFQMYYFAQALYEGKSVETIMSTMNDLLSGRWAKIIEAKK